MKKKKKKNVLNLLEISYTFFRKHNEKKKENYGLLCEA